MRNRCVILAGIALIAVPECAHAEIPVIDTAALAEWAQSLIDDVKSYALQLEQYITEAKQYVGDQLSWATQLQQYATELQHLAQDVQLFENFYHYPSLGAAMGLLSVAGLTSNLPINPYSVLGLVNGIQYGNGGMAEITGLANSLSGLVGTSWGQSHVYTPTTGTWDDGQIIANANSIAGTQGSALTAYQDLQTHTGVLPGLRTQLLDTSDSKGVADASAQVQLEIAYNVNETAKLQAIDISSRSHADSLVQQSNEKLSKDIETFLATSPTP